MVWKCINFQFLLHKKGLLLTVIRIRGFAETRRCGAVAVRSQVITWSSTLTLYALYLSRPLLPPSSLTPAPPLLSQARSLIATLVHSYMWYTGASQNNFLWQKHPAFNFEKISPILFCFAAWRSCFFATPFAKNALPSPLLNNPRILLDFSFAAAFSPFSNECQLFMPKDFLEPPCLTLLGVVPGFMREGEGGNR